VRELAAAEGSAFLVEVASEILEEDEALFTKRLSLASYAIVEPAV
jgi:hypothetical protein